MIIDFAPSVKVMIDKLSFHLFLPRSVYFKVYTFIEDISF